MYDPPFDPANDPAIRGESPLEGLQLRYIQQNPNLRNGIPGESPLEGIATIRWRLSLI